MDAVPVKVCRKREREKVFIKSEPFLYGSYSFEEGYAYIVLVHGYFSTNAGNNLTLFQIVFSRRRYIHTYI